MTRGRIAVIDPAVRSPELDALNALAEVTPLPLSYHLPAMFGFASFAALSDADLRGIIVLGSRCSVNDRLAWQEELASWLMPRMQRGVPTLGLCYGHQLLAFMFGGKVEQIFPDGSKHLGLRTIRFAEQLPTAVPQAWRGQSGSVIVSHQEHVCVVPKDMRILASSDVVACDGLVHEQLPIFSFQSHPEATAATARGFDIQLTAAQLPTLAFGHQLLRDFCALAAKSVP